MEISFAKRYRMYEKSTIATDYNNLLGDKPKTIINQTPSSATTNNNNNNKENKYSTQFNLTSPRASAYNNNSNRTLSTYNNRPLTTALIYKQTNNLLDKSESITKKYNANYNSKSYGLSNNNNNKTNLYYSSPVNSDFFENIRLNEFKFYNKTYGSNSQLRSTSAYVPQPPAPLPSYSQLLNSNNNNTNNKLPNNIKLKQQILNQYYKNTPVISSLERSKTNTNLTPTNTTTTTTTPTTYIPNMINNKLASYLKKSKLTNDEINKYLAYKKKSVIFNDISHHHHQELETNNNKRAMSHKINNNLNNSYNSFNNNTTNSIIIETNTRLNTAQNRSNIVNNKPNRSAIPISASFNNNNLKKKFNQLNNNNSSRPMSSNLNQSKSIINSNKQSQPVVKSNNSFKYFDEKFLKQKSSANQQKINNNNNNNKSTVNIKNNNDRKFTASRTTTAAGVSTGFKKYDIQSSESQDGVNLAILNKNDLHNYIDDDEDDEDDEEEEEEGDEEDELDEARYNQLLAEDAAMMAISNKKCNDWLNNHVMPFFNSATSSPINGDYDSNDIDDDNEGENIIKNEY